MDEHIRFAESVPLDLLPIFLEGKLKPYLPYSLPLYRRSQFQLRDIVEHQGRTFEKSDFSRSPEIWVGLARSTLEPESVSSDEQNVVKYPSIASWLAESEPALNTMSSKVQIKAPDVREEWLAAHIDLSNPGQTAVCLFASWEPSSQSIMTPQRVALFQHLADRIRHFHIPCLPVDPPESWQAMLNGGKIISVPYKRSKVLFGGIAEPLWPFIQDDVLRPPEQASIQKSKSSAPAQSKTRNENNEDAQNRIVRGDEPYQKLLIPVTSVLSQPFSRPPTTKGTSKEDGVDITETSKPPQGFHFGPLSAAHLQLMLDRTIIPRSLKMVQSLVSVGLFPDSLESNLNENESVTEESPIAWGIVSKDGSISSLHTEPKHRGRGLAERITRELIRLQKNVFRSDWLGSMSSSSPSSTKSARTSVTAGSEEQIIYTHTDVSVTNRASRRAFQKMGAKEGWLVLWLEIDLGED